MRLEKPLFEKMLALLKEVAPKLVHAKDAKLFFAKEGSKFPPVCESIRNHHNGDHLVYATINDKTLLIERGIIPSLISSMPEATCQNACIELDGIVGKPLEVLAMELTGEDVGKYPKWQVWLLRDGNGIGFLHDTVAEALRKNMGT